MRLLNKPLDGWQSQSRRIRLRELLEEEGQREDLVETSSFWESLMVFLVLCEGELLSPNLTSPHSNCVWLAVALLLESCGSLFLVLSYEFRTSVRK